MTPTPVEKIKLALVDDDAACRKSLPRLLGALGLACEAYASVADFIRSNAIHRIDCLLLDLQMPEINGLALQKCLRETNSSVPIIFCSGVATDETRAEALELGAAAFLQKPVRRETLLAALQKALPAGVALAAPG